MRPNCAASSAHWRSMPPSRGRYPGVTIRILALDTPADVRGRAAHQVGPKSRILDRDAEDQGKMAQHATARRRARGEGPGSGACDHLDGATVAELARRDLGGAG